MTAFTLRFNTGNADFADNGAYAVTRCLRHVIEQIESGRPEGFVFDVNGNRVGEWSMELPDDSEDSR